MHNCSSELLLQQRLTAWQHHITHAHGASVYMPQVLYGQLETIMCAEAVEFGTGVMEHVHDWDIGAVTSSTAGIAEEGPCVSLSSTPQNLRWWQYVKAQVEWVGSCSWCSQGRGSQSCTCHYVIILQTSTPIGWRSCDQHTVWYTLVNCWLDIMLLGSPMTSNKVPTSTYSIDPIVMVMGV